MLLTLENIQNQQFNQRFRGYDMAEVDAFLDKIAETYLFLSTENNKIKEELSAIKNERNQSLEEEQQFKNAIISAQSFADDLKNKAEKQAVRLKEDTKEKSTAILKDAQKEVNILQEQISTLTGEKERIKDELRSFLNSYLAQVDNDTTPQPQVKPPVEVVSINEIPEFITEDREPEPDPELEMEAPDPAKADDLLNEDDDVAILYEKIDLDDDFNPIELSAEEGSETPTANDNDTIPEFSTDELNELDMPDLEGDILYSLEDPLDNPEPAVIIEPLSEEEK